jgi:hypothetical protein
MDNYFKSDRIQKVPVTITSTVDVGCGWFKLLTCSRQFSFPYSMTIFPKIAIVAEIEQSKTADSTDHTTRKLLKTAHAHANSHDKNGGPWAADDYPLNADPGYAITEIGAGECKKNNPGDSGNPCAFVYPDPNMWDSFKHNGGAFAQIFGTNNSLAVNLYYPVYEEKKITQRIMYAPVTVAFGAGETKQVDVKSDARYVSMTIKPAIGNSSVVNLVPAGGKATDLVTCTGGVELGGGTSRYTCAAKGYDAF